MAYDILVGGLLVPILGGLLWRRGTNVGLASGLLVFVVGGLLSKPTASVVAEWDRRSRGESMAPEAMTDATI